jgi:hypothetical protein
LKIFAEMFERAAHGKRCQAAEPAQRSILHRVAEFIEQRQIGGGGTARREDPVHELDAPGGTNPARRALAAGFDRAEFEREAESAVESRLID